MKIYFSGSIAGGRKYLTTYQKMVGCIRELGHTVLTEHIIHPRVLDLEKRYIPREIYTRDIQWIEECDCMIAEVSNPSLGVGYEICYALRINKPVLCLYEKGIFLTRMLVGNTSKGLAVKEYDAEERWKDWITRFLQMLK
jgi:hypothetical protein